jgi:hypothetical protein
MSDIYVIQEALAVDPTRPSSRSDITVLVTLCAVSADGSGEDFPFKDVVPVTFPAAQGPSKLAIRTAIAGWATTKGHTALKVVYADLTMDSL